MTPRKIIDAPLSYLLHAPDVAENAPLVLFLHGSGERGSDLERVATVGLPYLLERLPEPAFVVAPQCPENGRWTDRLEELEALLDDLLARYPVDSSRIYLTGLSLGGQGAWYLAALAHGGVIQPSCAALGGLVLASLVLKEKLAVQRAVGGAIIVAGLAVIDMVKAIDRDAMITDVRVVAKSGGRSGDYRRAGEPR